MGDLILIVVIFIAFSFASFFILKSTLRQIKIRRAIRTNALLLTRMREKEAEGNFHTYNALLSSTLVNLRGKLKRIPKENLKRRIDREINNLSSELPKRILSIFSILLKIIFSIGFLFMSFFFALLIPITYSEMGTSTLNEEKSEKSSEVKEEKKKQDQLEKEEKEKELEQKKLEKEEKRKQEMLEKEKKEKEREQRKVDKEEQRKQVMLEKEKEKEQKSIEKEEKRKQEKIEKEKKVQNREEQKQDKKIYEDSLIAVDEGRKNDAIVALNKIKKESAFYDDAQEILKSVDEELYWRSVNYLTYAEITKSPQNYINELVGFSGVVNNIVEYNGKTLIVIGTIPSNDYYNTYGGDILVLYSNVTDYAEGDSISIAGKMKGSYLQTEQKSLIGNYFNSAYSFTTSGYINIDQMPVIIADHLY